MNVRLPSFDPPADFEVAAPFWEAVQQGQLVLPQCSVCRRWQWYPDDAGADCPDGKLVWVPVPLTGTLHTFTRVWRPFLPDQGDRAPFVVGFIELDGVEGLRLVANLVDDDRLCIGQRVAATFERVGGRLHPVFAPVTP